MQPAQIPMKPPLLPLAVRRAACGAAALMVLALAFGCVGAPESPVPDRAPGAGLTFLPAVPYVPTPEPVVEAMLDMARVGSGDVVYDLGCGDGRIVIAAASRRAARGVGIDIDADLVAEANRSARDAGVADRARFHVGDLFRSDFSEATVVMLYLSPELNAALQPQLWRQLKVGTRVVSHNFPMGADWPPEREARVGDRVLRLWTIRSEHKERKGP